MQSGFEATGFALVVAHVRDLALVFVLLAVCHGLGKTLVDRVLADAISQNDHALIRLVYSIACGVGLLGTWILIGCWAAGVHAWTLALLFLPPVIAGGRNTAVFPSELRKAWREFARGVGVPGQVIFTLVVGLAVVLSLAPPTDWDALVYHLEAPRVFLEAGRIHVPDDNLHVAYVGLLHMLYLPLMAFGNASAPAVLNASFAALLAFAVYAIGSRFVSATAASWAPSLLWGTTTLILVAATARLDTTLAFFLLLGHGALLVLSHERWSRQWLVLSALCLGFAGGMKYHALAYLGALLPMIVWMLVFRAPTRSAALRGAGLGALVVTLCLSPWFAKNLVLFGAPTYPFLAERRVQGWIEPIAGRDVILSNVDPGAFRAYGRARTPFNIRDLLFDPGRLTVEHEGLFYSTNLMLTAVVLTPFFVRDLRLIWLVVPPITYLALVVLPFPATNVRYLIPAIPPLTIASAEITRRVVARFAPSPVPGLVLGTITTVTLVPLGISAGLLFQVFRAPQHAIGVISAGEYLSGYTITNVHNHWALARTINQETAGERVLMLFDGRGFYFTAPVIQDNAMTNWPLLVGSGADRDCLRGTDIGFVLLNTGVVEYFQGRGVDLEPLAFNRFPTFAERCLTVVQEWPGFVLYRVRRPE